MIHQEYQIFETGIKLGIDDWKWYNEFDVVVYINENTPPRQFNIIYSLFNGNLQIKSIYELKYE